MAATRCPVIAGRQTGWKPCGYPQDNMKIPDGADGWRKVKVCTRPDGAHMIARAAT